ncbi:hypothetical protein CsSME_00038526 [Camellia sinensis var. sinensis]
MAKIRAIKYMITGEPRNSQLDEMIGGQISRPAVQEGPVLALASEAAAGRSKKRPRNEQTEQHLVNKDSAKLSSTEHGE